MENRKSLIFITFVSFLLLPPFTFAYKPDTTHKGLTRDVLRFYENYYPNKLNEDEKVSIEKGAVEEDNGVRALNHFYDPVYNKGIALTSKDWADNTQAQAITSGSYLAGLGNATQGYFSSATDYSWDRAVYEYTYEDKKRGLESLGHILHLIEDATVPDHTRDDPHPDFVYHNLIDQESPYENFTGQFDTSNINFSKNLINEGLKPIFYSTLNEYFDKVASYSNNNFFSKDTIFDKKYNSPSIIFEKSEKLSDGVNHRFGYNNIDGKLVEIKKERNKSTGAIDVSYIFDDKDHLVVTSYWNLLSRQAVQNGAGVIKLFFDEVEKEKQTHALYDKNKSWLARAKDNVLNIFSSSSDAPQNQNIASAIEAVSANENVDSSPLSNEEPAPESPTQPVQPDSQESPQETVLSENTSTETNSTVIPETAQEPPQISIPTPFAIPPGAGFGGGIPTPTPIPEVQSTISPVVPAVVPEIIFPDSPVITSPASFSLPFATTTIVFFGSAFSGRIISTDFSGATTSVDSAGDWAISLTPLAQGATTINFYATDANGTSSPLTISFSVDTISPPPSTLSINECAMSLISGSCLVSFPAINLSWGNTANDISYYSLFQNGIFVSTTTNTSVAISLATSTASFEIVAYDSALNFSTSSPQSVQLLSSIGYYCDPYTSTYIEGGVYTHIGATCRYLSPNIIGFKIGDIYKGTVGSSTIINGHSLGSAVNSMQFNDNYAGAVTGDRFFVAIYQQRTGPNFTNDFSVFRNYFQTGANQPPHLNFGVLNFVYGP